MIPDLAASFIPHAVAFGGHGDYRGLSSSGTGRWEDLLVSTSPAPTSAGRPSTPGATEQKSLRATSLSPTNWATESSSDRQLVAGTGDHFKLLLASPGALSRRLLSWALPLGLALPTRARRTGLPPAGELPLRRLAAPDIRSSRRQSRADCHALVT